MKKTEGKKRNIITKLRKKYNETKKYGVEGNKDEQAVIMKFHVRPFRK